MEPPVIEADEVIPPGAQSASAAKGRREGAPEHHDATAKIVARWLDDLIRIPGTKFSMGLDPLIALVPGVGDILSNSVSAVVIIESVRKGVAASVIVRMGLNMLINALLDGIPLAGPVVSAFFKSNSRNLELLRRWEEGEHHAVRRGSRIFLMTLVCVFFMLLGAAIIGYTILIWSFIRIPMKLVGF
jgi:hypothetical protein